MHTDQSATQPKLSFVGAPPATLDGLASNHLVFVGICGDTGNARANATPAYTSAASAVRAASNELLRPYLESPTNTVFDLDTGQRTRQRTPNCFRDLGNVATPRGNDWNDTCAAIGRRLILTDTKPILVGGDDDFLRSLIPSIQGLDRSVRIIEISDRCLSVGLGFQGAVLTIGASGLQNAESLARQVSNGGATISAEEINTSGVEGVTQAVVEFAPNGTEYLCVLDCRSIDIAYASGSDSFTVAGLTPEQFVLLSRVLGTLNPPMATTALNIEPSRDPRGHMEYLVAEALHAIYADEIFEEVAN